MFAQLLGLAALWACAQCAPSSHVVRSSAFHWANAQDAAKVGTSYAGHITVRDTPQHQAGLFYWYFPVEGKNPSNSPLVIWIQGGPGGSSVEDGLFFEMGPLRVVEEEGNFTFQRNPHTWTSKYSMLFIDQPVGTGYSYVDPPSNGTMSPRIHNFWTKTLLAGRTTVQDRVYDATARKTKRAFEDQVPQLPLVLQNDDEAVFKNGYAGNEAAVSKDFITFMLGFYKLYPELAKVDLHLTSESYGGKYVPEIATAIAKYNDAVAAEGAGLLIPLKTLAIGNQWTDPDTQIGVHPDHFLQVGLIDDVQASLLAEPIAAAREAIKKEDWLGGLEKRSEMFEMLATFTGGINWYDFRLLNQPLPTDHIVRFLKLKETRKALHVESPYEFGTDSAVFMSLLDDNMKTTKPLFPALFKRYKVLLYQGNYDLRDGVVSNSRWIETIDWEGKTRFKYSPRQVWLSSSGLLQGYVQQYTNLTRVVLTGCGHLAPADAGCPAASLEMISRHIDNAQFL